MRVWQPTSALGILGHSEDKLEELARATLMIKRLMDFPGNVVALVCQGRVTKADYNSVLVPAVLDALRTHDKVRLYYETAGDFAGIDPGQCGKTSRSGWNT